MALSGTGAGTVSTNLAAGKATSESSHTDVYPSSNVTDGNQGTYWESANNAFPQWVQVDLGSSAVGRPGSCCNCRPAWGARNETLSLLGFDRRDDLHHGEGVGGVHVRPVDRQHRHHHVPGDLAAVLAGHHHRQHRLAGRPDLRVPGLEPVTDQVWNP